MDKRYTRAHKQRKGRRRAVEILNSAELAQRLDVTAAGLEDELIRLQLRYHKDAQGEFWVSIPTDLQLSSGDE